MHVCLIQSDPSFGRGNLAILSRMIAAVPADVFVLPELFTLGFETVAYNWPAGAEVIPHGTYREVSDLLAARPNSSVVCGMLERDGPNFFNIAAVITYQSVGRYRERWPATRNAQRILPIQTGDFQEIKLASGWTIGMMVCHDYYAAADFFEEYSRRGVDAVVLIADSTSYEWRDKFRQHCSQYRMDAIICNSAGRGKGGSCILDRTGRFIGLSVRGRATPMEYLSETVTVASATLGSAKSKEMLPHHL